MFRDWGWRPYVSAAERRRKAAQALQRFRKEGFAASPVVIEGRAIARTFWGKAWCDNLERYSDFASRLPRGRSYVRNGSVIDLQIAPGKITARVMGSAMYEIAVRIAPVSRDRWLSICNDCGGAIDSLVELLQGSFSKAVMERICRQRTGLFPSPEEIELSCSCPDWANMCKHVAAVLYGVGARLDKQPELLFRLYELDEKEMIARAANALPLAMKAPARSKVLSDEDFSELFGLDMAQAASAAEPATIGPAKNSRPRLAAKPKPQADKIMSKSKSTAKARAAVKIAARAAAGRKQPKVGAAAKKGRGGQVRV